MAANAKTDETVRWCCELLAPLGSVRAKRMFGGHGLYVDEVFVAIIVGDDLFLKTDEASRPAFEAAGCHPFEFQTADGKKVAMSYWSAPAEAMDSPAQMLPWARQALASALRARASKPPARPRAPRAKAPAKAATRPPSKGKA
ncbi:MAG TPA: TfoX/Sxy family protein [Ideonella sp.]|jgi:DNA transformation protein|nr:TfoX/Sxy family protein [Ideonella sp.]